MRLEREQRKEGYSEGLRPSRTLLSTKIKQSWPHTVGQISVTPSPSYQNQHLSFWSMFPSTNPAFYDTINQFRTKQTILPCSGKIKQLSKAISRVKMRKVVSNRICSILFLMTRFQTIFQHFPPLTEQIVFYLNHHSHNVSFTWRLSTKSAICLFFVKPTNENVVEISNRKILMQLI